MESGSQNIGFCDTDLLIEESWADDASSVDSEQSYTSQDTEAVGFETQYEKDFEIPESCVFETERMLPTMLSPAMRTPLRSVRAERKMKR